MNPAAPILDLAFTVGTAGSSDAGSPPLAASLLQTASPLADPLAAEERWCHHLGRWLADLAAELSPPLRAPAYSLGLTLTDDPGIAVLNNEWRHQEGPTDVLAFAAQEEAPPGAWGTPAADDEPLELGDIVISLDTAVRQAQAAGHSVEEELLFLASHGLLHLLGWDHPDDASLAVMLQRQEQLLALI
jgi:probable rRNA maturation factor